MRRLLLFFLMFTPILASAEVDSSIKDFFSKYENESYIGQKNVDFLKKFEGDTVTFNFSSQYLDCFTVEKPDTVWLKKRPKKNPELGKHFRLNNAYKGVQVGDNFLTPSVAINDKPFALYSITPHRSSEGCWLTLLDLESLDLIKLNMPASFAYDGSFTTAKTSRKIESLVGNEVYYSADAPSYISSYSKPEFSKCNVVGGDFIVKISKSTGMYSDYKLNTSGEIRLRDADGKLITMSPLKSRGYSTRTPLILTQEEYDNQFKGATIDSNVDFAILDEDPNFPFSFGIIPAVVSGSYVSVYQSLEPNSSYRSADAHINSRELITIGDRVSVGGKEYYKACMNGKAFFINTKDVIILEDEEAKLDTLLSQSHDIRDKFFKRQVALSKIFHMRKIDKGIEEVESYAKYGLAIPKWGVYDMSEYTDGTGIRFTFFNPTKQDIKYVTVTFQGYNAVDDPVGKPITKRCIGPIEPDESASYDFDYAWFTDIVEYAKIRSISVQYRNGSTKSIPNPHNIVFPHELREFFYGTDPVEKLR